ncbi:hypothetical protein CBL_11004 [Carabus blaptoides fortunei]
MFIPSRPKSLSKFANCTTQQLCSSTFTTKKKAKRKLRCQFEESAVALAMKKTQETHSTRSFRPGWVQERRNRVFAGFWWNADQQAETGRKLTKEVQVNMYILGVLVLFLW